MFGNARNDRAVKAHTPVVDTIPVGLAVLQKVVAKFGEGAAAARLGITQVGLARYLSGAAPVPDRVLLLAVDIVLEEWQDRLAPSRSFPNRLQS